MSQPSHQRVGQYNFLRKLGAGRIAEVYLGRIDGAEGFQKPVAIKKILPQLAADPAFVTSLIAEAKIGGQLHHRNIVEVYDFIRYEDQYCIIMEYVEGVDLSRVIRAAHQYRIRIPPAASLYIISQICDGLDYAHSARGFNGEALNIIHRDLKPSNILISTKGGVKISDFGVARVVEQALQRTGTLGSGATSVQYQSPEQATGGHRLTPASDVFSVGAVFFELLTLEPLFPEGNVLENLDRLRDADLSKRLQLAQRVLPGSDKILAAALHPNPARRYKSAGLMGEDIRRLLAYLRVDDPRERLITFFWRLVRFIREKSKEQRGAGASAVDVGSDRDVWGAEVSGSTAPTPRHPGEETGEFGPYDEDGQPSWGEEKGAAAQAAEAPEPAPAYVAPPDAYAQTGYAEPAAPSYEGDDGSFDRGAMSYEDHYEDEDQAYAPGAAYGAPPETQGYSAAPADPWGGVATGMVPSVEGMVGRGAPSPDATVARPYDPDEDEYAAGGVVQDDPAGGHHELTSVRPPTHVNLPVSPAPAEDYGHDPDRTYLRPSPPAGGWSGEDTGGTAILQGGGDTNFFSQAQAPTPAEADEEATGATGGRSRSVLLAVGAVLVLIAAGAGLAYWWNQQRAAGPAQPPPVQVAVNPPVEAVADPPPAADPLMGAGAGIPAADPSAATPAPAPAGTGAEAGTGNTGASAGSAGSGSTGSGSTGSGATGSSPSYPKVEPYVPPSNTTRTNTGGSSGSSAGGTGSAGRDNGGSSGGSTVTSVPVYTASNTGGRTQPVRDPTPFPTPVPKRKPDPTPAPKVAALPPPQSAADVLKQLFADPAAANAQAAAGKLSPDQIGALTSVGVEDEDRYTTSRSLLALNYKSTGNRSEYGKAVEDLFRVPANEYNPVLRLEQAEYYLTSKKYQQAIDSAAVAERYRQKFPKGDTYYTLLARTYEVLAKSYEGRYTQSEDPDDLDLAINMWGRYLTHVQQKGDAPRIKMAQDNVAKLERIKERAK